MDAHERRMSVARVAAVTAVVAAISTAAIELFFAFSYRDCDELECFGMFAFVPVGAVVALIEAIVIGAQAGRGWQGFVVALGSAAFGFVGAIYLLQALGSVVR